MSIDELDLIEINEAFAGATLASTRDLDESAERVNVNGRAIALGHPVGMCCARLVLTLALELRRRGGGIGLDTLKAVADSMYAEYAEPTYAPPPLLPRRMTEAALLGRKPARVSTSTSRGEDSCLRAPGKHERLSRSCHLGARPG